jgi:REP element-mobilizing transposase RayT
MWNDTDSPLAFLITFRTYGTWLHGDERGSIDRHNNAYGSPKYRPNEHWNQITADRMLREPVKLDIHRRKSTETAIREVCSKRNWRLFAVNVRTNHAHSVVTTGGKKPSIVLNAFKSNATRQMREDGCWTSDKTPWADKGSERWLWTEEHIAAAVEYVLFGQGGDLPHFD